MKKILLFTFLAMPLIGMCQIDSSLLQKAGRELIKYERQFNSGIALQIGGLGLVAVGSAGDIQQKQKTPIVIAGGFLALIGSVIQILSASHIKKAGIYLTGNKLIIPIRSRK